VLWHVLAHDMSPHPAGLIATLRVCSNIQTFKHPCRQESPSTVHHHRVLKDAPTRERTL